MTRQINYKSPMSVSNSVELVNAIKSTNLISNNEHILVSFDIVNLYTNVPVIESLNLLIDYLNNCSLIDNCVWCGTIQELKSFLEFINSLSKIKFTLEISEENTINFLDLNITLKPDNTFEFNIYRKPTQTDIVIPKYSYHSPQIKTFF
ncbi:uncharacterized protein LOC123317721 [Coccinella septempunctata]|uniref:uncharacterized protein LOC123317721 n=1 Tax=Coccinella septempunctata TaxID=41139 RepID=UPI001D093A58|nr:uncharacterized protein LOC123317721 [Coccinella septempunctata]